MYIISKFKDYYDGVAGSTGIDKTIVYDRELIEVDESKYLKEFRRYSSLDNKKPYPFVQLGNFYLKKELRKTTQYEHTAPFIIGFCGKLYIGWKLYSEGDGNSVITTITYDLDRIENLHEQYAFTGNFKDKINYILSYDPIKIFRDLNSPIFVYDYDKDRRYFERHCRNNTKFFINPMLKEYEFFKIFDSYQAFQEIQMFLSGVLGNKEKEIIVVEDKYKIASHGFDKWSFRKEPENKKV